MPKCSPPDSSLKARPARRSLGCCSLARRLQARPGILFRPFEQNMEKARGAMDNYFSFLQNIWGSNHLTEKMKTYTAP